MDEQKNIILSKMNQAQRQRSCELTSMWNLKGRTCRFKERNGFVYFLITSEAGIGVCKKEREK